MLLDPLERTIVSSSRDRGRLWIFDITARRARLTDACADYLSVHAGRDGHFAVLHQSDDGQRVEIAAHSFDCPDLALSRCVVTADEGRVDGSASVWTHLPTHFVAYVAFARQTTSQDPVLISIHTDRTVSWQTFDWFDDSYDKGYQGVVGVASVPDSWLVLVSVQRSSKLVLYDPVAGRRVTDVLLANRQGNPCVCFRCSGRELLADDYDTLLKLEPWTWRVLQQTRLQEASTLNTMQFTGQFAFDADETVCAVARPFSGDVVGLDPDSFRLTSRAIVGGQPLELAVLRDRRVFAQDWKSGILLTGRLEPIA